MATKFLQGKYVYTNFIKICISVTMLHMYTYMYTFVCAYTYTYCMKVVVQVHRERDGKKIDRLKEVQKEMNRQKKRWR